MSSCRWLNFKDTWYAGDSGKSSVWHRISSLKSAGTTVHLFDGSSEALGTASWKSSWNTVIVFDPRFMVNDGTYDGARLFRHSNQINMTFADGHAESINVAKEKAKKMQEDYVWYPGYTGKGGEN